MSRSPILLVLLATSLCTSACVDNYDHDFVIERCEDLSVGDQTIMTPNFTPTAIWQREWGNWTLNGPGTLEPSESAWEAQYSATQAGPVHITFIGQVGLNAQIFAYSGDALKFQISSLPCTFEVFDVTVASEGTRYEVTAVVTVLTVEGLLQIGDESAAIWRLVFDCPDGRCDAEVHDGGPYGVLAPFAATYRDDIENFVFDFVLDTPANETCGDDRWVGEINPLDWDDQGPVGFTFTMVNVLTCDTGDLVIEWEGEATRG